MSHVQRVEFVFGVFRDAVVLVGDGGFLVGRCVAGDAARGVLSQRSRDEQEVVDFGVMDDGRCVWGSEFMFDASPFVKSLQRVVRISLDEARSLSDAGKRPWTRVECRWSDWLSGS